MNASQSYKKIYKASTILVYGWVANNLIGTVSNIFLIYFIWWKFHMGFFGIFMFLLTTWIVNGLILPTIFRLFNQPFAMQARDGAIELEDMGIIDAELSFKLNNTKVEYWPKYITQGLSDENLNKIFPGYKDEK